MRGVVSGNSTESVLFLVSEMNGEKLSLHSIIAVLIIVSDKRWRRD
jgi:hypothetical protein